LSPTPTPQRNPLSKVKADPNVFQTQQNQIRRMLIEVPITALVRDARNKIMTEDLQNKRTFK
jgi:hypothetical protein